MSNPKLFLERKQTNKDTNLKEPKTNKKERGEQKQKVEHPLVAFKGKIGN